MAATNHETHEHDGHDHGIANDADGRYLWTALLLLVAFMVTEVIVAVTSGSLALLSDAGHMLSDVGAIAASIWAMRLAARPAAGAWTSGGSAPRSCPRPAMASRCWWYLVSSRSRPSVV
jgi:Co/Zn/Cd efflux system component